jgi:RNA polymerase sigma-70 factor (ECF subfamily)
VNVSGIPPDSSETLALLEEVRRGERAAFERLFARHRPALRRFIDLRLDRRVRARLDPSDVVQETQMEAYSRLPDFLRRQPMPFHVWLRRTAYERLLKVRRQHVESAQRSVQREEALPDRSSVLLARRLLQSGLSPSRHAIKAEMAARVADALGQLPETDREVLVMRHVEQRPYEEVAYILGIEAAAARKRYGRALLRLRGVLFAGGGEDAEP